MKKRFLGILCLVVTSYVFAQGEKDTEPVRDFGFRPLEIYEFKYGINHLILSDLNGDGLDDVLFVNNRASRLEILLRKPAPQTTEEIPVLEDYFENKGMIVDQSVRALRVADLNNDNLPDLITFGTALGLQIRYQNPDHSFAKPQRIFLDDLQSVTTIKVGDLNGDGRKDLLVPHRKEADLLWNDPVHPFREKKTLVFASDKSYYGDVADFNNDGISDLIFYFSHPKNPIRIRLGKGDGLFGIEQPIQMPPRQYMDLLQFDNLPAKMGLVLRNRLAFRLYGFTEKEQPLLLDTQETLPVRIGLEGMSKKAAPSWVVADFNADGYDDLLISAPELSQLHLYEGGSTGLNPEPKRIDTLSSVNRVSQGTNNNLLVVSRTEKTAAIHAGNDLEKFPTLFKLPGDVLAGNTITGKEVCWFVCKDSDKKLQLVRTEENGEKVSLYPLDLKNSPNDLLAFSLPENKTGLLLFMPYDTPKMFLYADEKIEELTSDSFRALTLLLAPENIRMGTPGDGSTLFISKGAIARRYDWTGDRYKVVRQFNPEDPQGDLVASCDYQLINGDSGRFFYDRHAEDLIYFPAQKENWKKIHILDASSSVSAILQLKNPDRDTILLLDRAGINEVLGNGYRMDCVSEGEYVSPSEEPKLAFLKAVHLGTPPRPMIALVDPANRAVELVGLQNEELKKELLFEVFLDSDFAQRSENKGTEPHDIESADLNGDGTGDLVLLCQDKLLIYLGE